MPSWIVPSDTHVVSDTGHTTDHDHIVDDLSLINSAAPVVSGGLTGATQATRYVGATTSGAPVSGTFAVGDFIIDRTGLLWICTGAGSPGTWVGLVTTAAVNQSAAGNKTFTGHLLTSNNTLDDGSGNASFVGNVTSGVSFNASQAGTAQFDGTGFNLYNTAAALGNQGGIAFFNQINNAGGTQGAAVINQISHTGAYVGTLMVMDLNAQTITSEVQLVAGAGVFIAAGTSSVAPIQLVSGTNLTSPVAGAIEYDGVATYVTNDTTSGRGVNVAEQRFRLTAAGSNISTIANYFGTNSNISLVANAEYEIEIDAWFLKTTAGTVTWTFTNSAAPTSMTIDYQMSPATGIVSTPAATDLFGQQYNVTTTAPTVVSPSLTTAVNHRHRFKIRLINGTGTSLKIQATAGAGTITPGINSYWKARRVPLANVGTFAA